MSYKERRSWWDKNTHLQGVRRSTFDIFFSFSSLRDNASGIGALLLCFHLADYIYASSSGFTMACQSAPHSSLSWRIMRLFNGHTCNSQINVFRLVLLRITAHFSIYQPTRLTTFDWLSLTVCFVCVYCTACSILFTFTHELSVLIQFLFFSCDRIWWWLISVQIKGISIVTKRTSLVKLESEQNKETRIFDLNIYIWIWVGQNCDLYH